MWLVRRWKRIFLLIIGFICVWMIVSRYISKTRFKKDSNYITKVAAKDIIRSNNPSNSRKESDSIVFTGAIENTREKYPYKTETLFNNTSYTNFTVFNSDPSNNHKVFDRHIKTQSEGDSKILADANEKNREKYLYNRHIKTKSESLQWIVTSDIIPPNIERHSTDDYPFRTFQIELFKYAIFNSSLLIEKCSGIEVLIYVFSAINNTEKRTVIRKNWGVDVRSSWIKMAQVFIIGRSDNSSLNDELKYENSIHNDIIIGDFLDTYYNLSLKSVMAISWIHTYCPNVGKVMKVDDDAYVNIPQLIKFYYIDLPALNLTSNKIIAGIVHQMWPVVTDSGSKWFVEVEEYKYTHYPRTVTGIAYIMLNETIHALYEAAFTQEYFKLEDVLVTGLMADRANITHINLNQRTSVALTPDLHPDLIFFNLYFVEKQERKRFMQIVRSQRYFYAQNSVDKEPVLKYLKY